MVWFEHDDELFNMENIVHVGCVGSFDIAFYERFLNDPENPEKEQYFLLCFESVRERNAVYEFIKKILKSVKYGQKDKGD